MTYIEDVEREWALQAYDDLWQDAMEHTEAPETFEHEDYCNGCDECLMTG